MGCNVSRVDGITAVLAELVLAVEQSCQELVDCAAVLAETTLANEHRHQKVVKCGATLGDMVLAKEHYCSLLAARAAELALATERVAVLADLADSVDLVLREPALAEDKRRQEEAAAEQCQADDKRFMAPVMPPDLVDVTIRRIWENCALCAAPLDAILAEIECDDIAHEAQALLTKTLPHPAAMMSTPPLPYGLCGGGPFFDGGEHSRAVLALAPLALPSPTVDGQLWTVRQRARPCHCTGFRHYPHVPSPPDKVLPHPHQTLGGLPTPTKTLTTLA
jgi:hypothetical protein